MSVAAGRGVEDGAGAPWRVALGGAGQGLGAACARLLAARGARLFLCARTAAEVEELAAGLRASGAEAHALACDLSSEAGAAAFADGAHRALGGVDLGLICAGAGHRLVPLAEAGRALLLDQLLQNAVGPALAAAALLRRWRADPAPDPAPAGGAAATHLRGPAPAPDRQILVLSSLATRRPPLPGAGPYTAAKAALEALVRALAEEAWPLARVNALCLPPVATRLHRLAGTPGAELARLPSPGDVAPLVLHACGAAARGLSGRVFDAEALAADAGHALRGDGRLALVPPLQPAPGGGADAAPEAEPGRRSSPRVRAALRASAAEVNRYPQGAAALAAAIAARAGVAPDSVVLSGGGATELLERALRALCAPGDEVVAPFPGYELLPALCSREGLRQRPVPVPPRADGLFGPLRAGPLLREAGPRTRVIYLASPDNPTGALLPPAEEAALVAGLGPGATLLVDEAWSLAPLEGPPAGPGAIRLRSFSKLLGLAGLRIGFALAPPELAALLRRLELPFPLGAPQIAAALAVLEDLPRLRRAALLLARERERTAAALRALGLAVSEGSAPVLLVRDVRPRAGAGPLLFALRAAEVPAREAHWDAAALVLALGSRGQNRRAVEALRRGLWR